MEVHIRTLCPKSPTVDHRVLLSGNGLVSYYINLVLEGVGVTKTETKVGKSYFRHVFDAEHNLCRPS